MKVNSLICMFLRGPFIPNLSFSGNGCIGMGWTKTTKNKETKHHKTQPSNKKITDLHDTHLGKWVKEGGSEMYTQLMVNC